MDTAYRRLLHQERCFEQVLRISPLALLFGLFFISFFCLHSKRSFGFRRIWSIIPLRETTLQRSFTQLTIVSGLFLSSTTTPHGWIRGGYLDAFTTGRDSIQAACFIWPFSFRYLWFSRKRRIRSNARRSAQVRDRNFSMESSLISLELSFPFFSLSFHLFGLERRLGRYPPNKDDRYQSLTTRTDTLCFFPWLCFPIYDDIILMTTFSTTR
jgi:hypothetical protein